MAKKDRTALTTQAQQIQTETSEKANTALRIGQMDQDLLDSLVHQDDPAVFTSVDLRYADIPAMLADQGSQTSKNLYFVTSAATIDIDGYAYFELTTAVPTGAIADYNVVTSLQQAFVDFTPQDPEPAHNEGRVFYNDVKKNYVFMNDRTDPRMDLGRENWARAINKTGSGTTNGKVVYQSNASGNLPEVTFAKADSISTAKILGIYTEDVAIDDDGEVTVFGAINDIDTSAWSINDELWLDAVTAGEMTNVEPVPPNAIVPLGHVITSHATTGIIQVNIGHIEKAINSSVTSAWSAFSGSTAATNWINGFYTFESAITPAGGTTMGTANVAYAAHAYFVLGATSTDMIIRTNGTRIQDDGTRTTNYNSDVDTSGAVLDDYFETPEKFIGQVTISLLSGTGVIVAYGWSAYWDNRNTRFVVSSLEWVGRAGASDTGPNISLYHHKTTGWTYNAAGAILPPPLVDMQTTYVTEYQFITGQYFKYKILGISDVVQGEDSEGIVIGIDITANNAVANSNIELQKVG